MWLPAKNGRVELATYDQYKWAVTRHIVPLLGAVRLRDVTAEVIDDWLRELSTAPDGGKARLGSTSSRLVRKVLSMALEEAVQRGRLTRNPVLLTQPPRASWSRQRLGWTLDEARDFLAKVADHRLAATFHLGLVTGLRRGEMLALRWEDVDLDGCQLQVVQQLAVERGHPVLKQLKTEASERVVTFGPVTAATLRRHRERQDRDAELCREAWLGSGLVFTTAIGGPIDPTTSRGSWTT